MIEFKQIVIFLDKMHLFSGLDQEQLGSIANRLVEKEIPAGSTIFKRGDKPEGFYMIYKGKVKVTLPDAEKGERQIATLYGGDYFGEEALFENRNRSATITAVEDSVLLLLSRPGFDTLLTQHEKLKPNFRVSIRSRKLARSTNFKWLGKNEVIYFIARRHKIRLFRALVAPFFSMLGAVLLILLGIFVSSAIPLAVGLALVVGILGWGIWNAIDWSNDYYIVTNQRVIWLEKVIGLHDSREEAPLGTILSVGVETDYLGRILDYGNVIVRTFVGKLEFDHVDHPVQAADMIREYWERTKAITTRSQMDVMKDTIKQKLGLPLDKRQQVELAPVIPVDEEKIIKTPLWLLALQNLVQLRIEEGGKIIYHKHWLILLRQGWKPIGLFFSAIILFFWRLIYLATTSGHALFHTNAAGFPTPDTLATVILILFIPIGVWVWYEYTDWKNDTFMITNDEIFDIDRKPFGTEERRSAQIENILSTSYKRVGFIAYIFNYGTVFITVGGTQMAFEDVMDPAAVQADINRRRAARITKKNENAGKEDRERFATWIAAYHQNMNEFNKPIKPPPAEPGTGPFRAAGNELEDLPLGGDDGIGGEESLGSGNEGNEMPGDF
ncbi:MAG: cyclic nucleotide-binding domain-containing protein [Anaerolineales bacterium]|nr:cyclic nucleotide-binding domain-containing protein [Anaerolineales bacterium]